MQSSPLLLLAALLCLATAGLANASAPAAFTPSHHSVQSRGLLKEDLTRGEVLDFHSLHSADANSRQFVSGFTLAYVTPWNRRGYEVAKQFALKFTHVSPVWFQIKLKEVRLESGKTVVDVAIEGGHDADAQWVSEVQEAGSNHATRTRLAVVPRFIVEPADAHIYTKLAQRKAVQIAVIDKILQTIAQYNLDGLVLEMTDAWAAVSTKSSAPKTRNDLNAFIMRLGSALHEDRANVKQLILVVRPFQPRSPYFQNFDFNAVKQFVDGFSLMTYDYAAGSAQHGPMAPLDWMKASVEALAGEDAKDPRLMQKIMMGLPLYGYRYNLDQPARPTPIVGHEIVKALQSDPEAELEYHDKWSEHSITLTNDAGEREQIAYPTPHFIEQRLELARQLGCSISLWEAGQGLDYFYDLF